MSYSGSILSIKTTAQNDKGIQTVIKVYPFVLPVNVSQASVTSDKKFCTVLSLETSNDSNKFYSLLQYCPYHDIEEHSIRVINLPRKTKLQWLRHSHLSEEILKMNSLADDDGVADICNDLLLRLKSGKKNTYKEADTQTDLTVRPYLLEEPNVAKVYRAIDTQIPIRHRTTS